MSETETWDQWNREGGPKYPHEKAVQFTFRNFPAQERAGRRALDLGCGSGVHTEFLAAEGFETMAIDISPDGVTNTRRRLDARGLTAELAVQDLSSLALPESRFDLVLCVSVFDAAGVTAALAGIGTVARSLVRGGRGLFLFASDRDFRVLDGNQGYVLHGWSRAEVERTFAGHFRVVHIDRYITTYENGAREQNDWLITVVR